MTQYFDFFPKIKIKYGDEEKIYRDISKRGVFSKTILDNPFLFLPYTVKDGERPEEIAYYYYGSTDYVWLILLANSIYDIYHDWPLSNENFEKYIIEKYKEKSGKQNPMDILSWTMNETIDENIVFYYKDILE